MDFGKKVEQFVSHACVVISDKADRVADIAALKYNRYMLEKERNAILRELGSYVYKAHLINPTHNDKVARFIEEIKTLETEIKKLNIKIEQR